MKISLTLDSERQAEPAAETPQECLVEMLRGRVGIFEKAGTSYNAEEASRAFADHLADKHTSGTL